MKEIFIERDKKLLRIAVKDNDKLKECYVEEEDNKPRVGEIYKGIVRNIVPAIKCVFIDIGYDKNCYMNLETKTDQYKLKKGDEILVEILKEDIDKKGPKVTNKISIPGTFVVLTASHNKVDISSKIKNNNFINELTKLIIKSEDIGVVIRTKAENGSIEEINSEIRELQEAYVEIITRFKYTNKLGLLYSDEGILSRTFRNLVDEDHMRVFLNNEEDYLYCKKNLEKRKDKIYSIELYNGTLSLFDYYNIEKEILALRNNKINLPSGGNIVIENTEAMHVIDVNSAKSTKLHNIKETALNTNLEAARVIVEQIRLRNIGGIVLVDFIDMRDEKDKILVSRALKEGFKDDKNNPKVYPFTELNLVQIARKRYGKSIYDYILEQCGTCKGKGNKIKLSYLSNIIKSKINRIKEEQGVRDIYIELDAIYEKEIKNDVLGFITAIGSLEKNIYVNFLAHLEGFRVEPLIFANQVRNLEVFKIYDSSNIK